MAPATRDSRFARASEPPLPAAGPMGAGPHRCYNGRFAGRRQGRAGMGEDGHAAGGRPRLTRAEWGLLLVLAAVQFTHIIDFVILMPLGPEFATALRIGPQEFGWMVSFYGFAACLS